MLGSVTVSPAILKDLNPGHLYSQTHTLPGCLPQTSHFISKAGGSKSNLGLQLGVLWGKNDKAVSHSNTLQNLGVEDLNYFREGARDSGREDPLPPQARNVSQNPLLSPAKQKLASLVTLRHTPAVWIMNMLPWEQVLHQLKRASKHHF